MNDFYSRKEERVERYGRFLKMTDNLQTPKYRINRNTEMFYPFIINPIFYLILHEHSNWRAKNLKV
jgi:hypothetical protein